MYERNENELQAQGWIKLPEEPETLFSDRNCGYLGMHVGDQVWIYEGCPDRNNILEWDDNRQWWIAPPNETLAEREFAFNWEYYCDPWELGGRAWEIIRSYLEQEDSAEASKDLVTIVFEDHPFRTETIDLSGAKQIFSYADANEESYAYRLPDGQVVAWTERRSDGWVRYAWSKEEIQERLAELGEDEDEEAEDE